MTGTTAKTLTSILVLGLTVGCTTIKTTETTTPLVALENGGTISIKVIQPSGSKEPVNGPLAVWKMPDGSAKTLVTLVPAPGSPAPVLRLDTSSPRYDDKKSRCWLLSNNVPIASFDYDAGVAILGAFGQPEWAKPDP